jgi:prolyl-tRNA synthetase
VQIVIVPILLGDKEKVLAVSRELQQSLSAARLRVQLDISDERPGAKFYKWEMKGVPIRLEVGPRDIEKGVVTLARRDGVKKAIPMEGLEQSLIKEADELQDALHNKAKLFMEEMIKEVANVKEARDQTQAGVALVPWCGEVDCGHQLEDQVGANMLGEPQYQTFPDAPCAVCGKKSAVRTYMAKQY